MASAAKLGRVISNIDNEQVGEVTVSIGVTPFLRQDTIDTVLKRVDQALYEAKSSGRNQVVVKLD